MKLDEFLEGLVFTRLTSESITDVDTLRAEIRTVRNQGYALIDQELEEGIRSVAAPLRDRRGRTLAAVNVGTHAARVTLKELRGVILPDLLTLRISGLDSVIAPIADTSDLNLHRGIVFDVTAIIGPLVTTRSRAVWVPSSVFMTSSTTAPEASAAGPSSGTRTRLRGIPSGSLTEVWVSLLPIGAT